MGGDSEPIGNSAEGSQGQNKSMQSDITKIASRIKLAAMNTGAWRATRLHKKETAKVNDDHHTGDAAKVHVRLTNSETLRAINCLTAEAYDAHRKLTLPAAQDGFRLLPVGREFEHSAKMAEYGAKHRALVAQFLGEYDAEKASAPVRLNGLYDAKQWPDRSIIAEKFLFSSRYLACPTDGSWADWITESARAAEDELRERLTDCLQRIAENCAKEKPKIYDTLFSNLGELLTLVPDFNFADNVTVYAASIEAKQLAALDAETIRENKAARRDAAKRANSILSALGAQ